MESFSNKTSYNRMFCFVDGCFTTSARNKNLGFHKFPGNERKTIVKINKNGVKKLVNRRQLWIEALNIDKQATTVIGEMRVCSLHFSKKDFVVADKKRPFLFLKRTAIPRRNLPLRKNSKLTTSLQFRNFNRIKWRGRLAFQDPDGRLPVSKRRSLGSYRSNLKKETVSDDIDAIKKQIRKRSLIGEIHEGESLDGEKIQLKTFSLAGNANTSFCSDSDQVDGRDNEIECTNPEETDETHCESQPLMTSEVIIKEEPLSDNEQEYSSSWPVDEEVPEYETKSFNTKNVSRENSLEITPKAIRDDLQSENEADDECMIMDKEGENDDEFEDENMSDGSEENRVWRDRPCKVCGKVDCKGHLTTCPSNNAFVCFVCSEIFDSHELLDEHKRIHDSEINSKNSLLEREQFYLERKELTCKVCKKVLATKLTLKEHMLIHTGEKPHVCMLCGRSFRHKANLVVHINAHTIVRTFECPMCPQTFSMRVDLDDHKRTFHADLPFTCNVCSESFHSKRALWTHQQVHNKRTQRKKRRGSRKGGLPCRVCGKILSTKNTLKEHMMIHSGEKPHECQLCGKMIRHKANFIIHVQSHSASEVFQCDVCDYSFPRKSDLRHHKQEEHGNKPFHCILCGASFRKEEGLMHHVENRHGDNPVKKDDDEDYEEYNGNYFRPHLLEGLGTVS